MPDINIKADVKKTSTLGKVKVLVEQVVGQPSQEAINTAVAEYIEAHPGSLSPLSPAVKAALLQIAEKVAYIDENGQDYYDALDAALNAVALLQITAVYTQTGTVYDTDSLDSLKADLVVTAYYDDGTTANVTALCTLSGTLSEGTSTITATYSGKSATFDVTVTHAIVPRGYTAYDYVKRTANTGTSVNRVTLIKTPTYADLNNLIIDFDFMPLAAISSATAVIGGSIGSGNANQVAFFTRTDTKRLSCFSHGSALACEGVSSIAVNSLTHVQLNPGTASPSALTVGAQSTTGAWTTTNVIHSELTICGNSAQGTSGTGAAYSNIAVGAVKVHDLSNNLVGDFVPCVRDSDNVIGIYDRITESFYTAATVSYATIGNANCSYAVGNLG